MGKRLEINKGDKFCEWTIIKETKTLKNRRYFDCICSCGNIRNITLSSLTMGKSKKCGFCKKGIYKTRIYKIYSGIIQRCKNIDNIRCRDYGFRGIRCEWNCFEDFYKDMGSTYNKGLTIEREDVNLNYNKENCKWATRKEQANNKRNNLIINDNGNKITLKQYCEKYKLNYKRVWARLKIGWDFKKAISTKDFRYT